MKTYKDIQITTKELVSITCDKCGKIATPYSETGIYNYDFQEWSHVGFTGGYGSIFGDGDEYEADFCQECWKELVGPYLRYLGNIA